VGKMKRRRPTPEAVEPEAVELGDLTLADFVDPRQLLGSDPALDRALARQGSDEARLRTIRAHCPQAVRSEPEARAHAEHLARSRRFQEARREARLRRLPAPEASSFFDGFVSL
jgi:hypothetical protein